MRTTTALTLLIQRPITAAAALLCAGLAVQQAGQLDAQLLSNAPLWARPFMIDSVIAAAAVAGVLLWRLLRASPHLPIVAAFALAAGLADGLWLLVSGLLSTAVDPLRLVSGLLLIGGAVVVLPTALYAALATRYAVGALLAVGMVIDYGLGYLPALPAGVGSDTAALIAAVVTVGLMIGMLIAPVRLPLVRMRRRG
jgi:hypothetical protein